MRLYGLTLDNCENVPRILAVLKALPQRATVRLVADPGISPQYYEPACAAISEVADILLQPVDSAAMKQYSTNGYIRRFQAYLGVLGKYAKYVEAGNEINGDWLGRGVALKVSSVLPLIKAAGLKSAVTYYWDDSLAPFARRNALYGDLTLISYYPNASECSMTLDESLEFLQKLFPGTTVGVGEYCDQDGDGKRGTVEDQIALVKQMEPAINGGFWWTAYQDLVETGALLPTFVEVWK